MPTRILSLVFAASLFFAAAARAGAQQPGGADVPQSSAPDASQSRQLLNSLFAPVTDQLNLTPEQQARIETIVSAEYTRSEALLQRLNQVTAALDEEQLKDTFDEDRVRALAAQGGQAMTEMMVMKLRVKAKVVALLTPTQKSLVEQQLILSRERGEALPLY
jgi:Spy/CpxP family protein refolding chaperone